MPIAKHLVVIENTTDVSRVPKNDEKERILQIYLAQHNKANICMPYDRDRSLYSKV